MPVKSTAKLKAKNKTGKQSLDKKESSKTRTVFGDNDPVNVMEMILAAQDVKENLKSRKVKNTIKSSRISFYAGFFLGMMFVSQLFLIYFSVKIANEKEETLVREAFQTIYAASAVDDDFYE